MANAKRSPRGDRYRGRGFEGLGIDLGGKLLVIHGRCWRERDHEKGRREDERRFPFMGVAQNRNILCRRSVF